MANKQQQIVATLIGETPKPSMDQAGTLLELVRVNGFPDRVINAFDDYLTTRQQYEDAKGEADRLQKLATEKWDHVRDEAARGDDLVDIAGFEARKAAALADLADLADPDDEDGDAALDGEDDEDGEDSETEDGGNVVEIPGQ
jgi:hypothetical protein